MKYTYIFLSKIQIYNTAGRYD